MVSEASSQLLAVRPLVRTLPLLFVLNHSITISKLDVQLFRLNSLIRRYDIL